MDSSGLVKLLVPDEVGGTVVRELLGSGQQPATSIVAYAESRAAIAAAARSGRMDTSETRHAVQELDALWPSLFRLAVTEPLVRLAGDLAERHKLRGFDSIHLASALTVGADVTMVCWDRDLAQAAAAEGLAVIPSLIP